MAGDGWRTRAGLRVIVVVTVLCGLVAPTAAQSTVVLGVDVARFSERAAAWSAANAERRAADLARAEELGRVAAAEEAEREAADRAAEAARAAAARAAATTTAPPTTTTAAPATTAPPTTSPSEPTTVEATTTTSVAPTTTVAPPVSGPTAEQWAALRSCESGGRYDAVSPSGRYRGAYQFSQPTWDWVASWADPALVGADPAAATVAAQDALALALYDRQGASPWPHCGVHLS